MTINPADCAVDIDAYYLIKTEGCNPTAAYKCPIGWVGAGIGPDPINDADVTVLHRLAPDQEPTREQIEQMLDGATIVDNTRAARARFAAEVVKAEFGAGDVMIRSLEIVAEAQERGARRKALVDKAVAKYDAVSDVTFGVATAHISGIRAVVDLVLAEKGGDQ